jgi:DNA-binding transcriptional LysR family regulator
VNLTLLRYARSVSREGSFSAAARACSVTQPALSHGIAVLERSLGGRLFDRTTRGATPTTFGDRVLPLIDNAIRALDALLTDARLAVTQQPAPLRVGVSPLISPELIGRTLEAASRCRPEHGVVLRAANLVDLRRALAEADLDMLLTPAVAVPDDYRASFERAAVASEPMMFLAVGSRPRADEPGTLAPIELADTTATPLVLPTDACGLTPFTRKVFADNGLTLETYPGQTHDCRTVQDWVALGLGSALLPRSKVNDGTPASPVHVGRAPVTITYEACWLATSTLRTEITGIAALMATPTHGPTTTAAAPPPG